ncbi:PLP-dependent aminotransferase family protein [Anoxynatronum buryatiense]|uniref:2-aminoadipate transaminase n=1 Tax=Anoxynatronum buryatiense TaxID=489973 RepID=A0AA45WWS2_9CLOT|nr:PLP-dependent aminotransferase family protein [Anoxynatronum buryatiense]SMP59193.1 2-aminoadipate transaminase [Anoxynatronum buryatiense]
MNIQFADRMNNLQASEIRELLKLAERPEIISFAGGLPAPELFPVEAMKVVGVKVLEEQGMQALQYSATEGYGPLREKIAARMAAIGVNATADNVLITSGSQQGLDFAGKVFLNEGDIVITERPSYLGAIMAFKAYSPEFVDIAMDDDGMDMAELERVLTTRDRVKMIYVIPDFQNPTGKTWSVERRKQLVELANRFDLPIVEDNPYGELRFEGQRPPAVKSFDTQGRVLFLGTFSKTFCPGMRLGWTLGEGELLNKFVLVKQGADLQTSSLGQRELNQFMEDYDLDEHIATIREVYRSRRDVMLTAMETYFPKVEGLTFTYPNGGLFTWVELPAHMNARELFKRALEKEVAFVPGGSFYPNGGYENTLRLNYSNMPEEKIKEGIKRLGEAIQEMM